jgi:glucose-1-phosphate thymidylyltransferase
MPGSPKERQADHGTLGGQEGPFFLQRWRPVANAERAPARLVSMEIAKAVVLAADCRGEEPWPSLGQSARQLAPVANKPVLFHHLEALQDAGVHEAAVVTDETTRASIHEAVGDGSAWGLEVSYLDEDEHADTLSSAAVADFAASGPLLVQHGDVLLRERLSALCDHFADCALDALVLLPGLGHQARAGPAPSCRDLAGYIIAPDALLALRRRGAQPERRDDALARLRSAGARVEVRDVDAWLPCRGTTEALLIANREMLDDVASDHRAERVFGSEIQGRVILHPSVEVHDSVLRGPAAIGPRTRIANAYIGPYTSIGADVEIDCVEIEHSIILDGAQIRFVGARIEGSLIGPRAHVVRDFSVPRALRLSVGERAHIALS